MALLQIDNARLPDGDMLPCLLIDNGRLFIDKSNPQAEQVDAAGRFIIPGLWDQHVHFSQWAMYSHRLDLSSARSAAEVASLCSNARRGNEPVLGFGICPELFPDALDPALLDQMCGDTPVAVTCVDLHSIWVNSAALAYYNMTGYEAGLLSEEPSFELQRRMGEISETTLDNWVSDAARCAAQRGIVGIVDMEMTWNYTPWQRRMRNGFDQLRVRAAIYPQHLDRALAEGLRSGYQEPELPLLEVGPLKCITDGSLNSKTAYCCDPYPGTSNYGVLNFSQAQLHDLMLRATAGGITCAIHAIGDEANRICLDEYAATKATGRIEHAQLLHDLDIARFAELGITASVQPQHVVDDQDAATTIWPDRNHRMYRFKDLIDAGGTLVFGSDAPVAALDPWHQIQSAIERQFPGSPAFFANQNLSIHQALTASTDRHSWLISDGMVADLVITDADPFSATGMTLRQMPVAATLLAGHFTHRDFS
ncbi:MAG: amidohydrolase [Propionibacteriaceae bacterium]